MDITIEKHEEKEGVSDVSLAEQTRDHVYVETKDGQSVTAEIYQETELIAAKDCFSAGYVTEDGEEVVLENVTYIEQEDEDTVYVEYENQTTERFTGEFDRAYMG